MPKSETGQPLNAMQEWLYETYSWGIKETAKFAEKDEIFAFDMGDISHGMKYLEDQINLKISPQFKAAAETFYPILDLPNVKHLRICAGTGAHTLDGAAEEVVTEYLRARYPKKDIGTTYHGILRDEQFSIDYAHHGPGKGSRNWLEGNVARLYLKSAMMYEVDHGKVPPNLYLRGHVHEPVKEWARVMRNGQWHESWIVVLPPLCLPGQYAVKVAKSPTYITSGTCAIEVINGKVTQTLEFTKVLDIRDEEKI